MSYHRLAPAGGWSIGVASFAVHGDLFSAVRGLTGAAEQSLDSDLITQLAYRDRVREFHRRLRHFYYGHPFTNRSFGEADFRAAPKFEELSQG